VVRPALVLQGPNGGAAHGKRMRGSGGDTGHAGRAGFHHGGGAAVRWWKASARWRPVTAGSRRGFLQRG
jgi:hypothetical protein